MNNKGFSTIEVILSFALVVIILSGLTAMTITYRDKLTTEETRTRLTDFKDQVTKVVYDDIITNKYYKIDYCNSSNKLCVNFLTKDNKSVQLTVETYQGKKDDTHSKGVYIVYNGTYYLLPDSDYNEYAYDETIDQENNLSYINEVKLYKDEENSIYSVTIPFRHTVIDYSDEIRFVIN